MGSYITIQDYCKYYEVSTEFFEMLADAGLIEFEWDDDADIDENQFAEIECYRKWHYELQINLEGIEVIRQLLKREEELKAEVAYLKSRLRIYE